MTNDTSRNAIEWAKDVVEITPCEDEIIMYPRRPLLYNGGSNWVKEDGTDFDVTMDS